MKLIDILVRDFFETGLPKDTLAITQDDDGRIKFCRHTFVKRHGNVWCQGLSEDWLLIFKSRDVATDCETAIVTRAQFEAALAASKVPAWNGAGLPPVGVECEIYQHPEFSVRPGTAETGTKVKVVAHETTTGKNSVAVVLWVVDGCGHSDVFIAECLRPLGTEAERKREAAIKSMREALGHAGGLTDVTSIYRAIAEGKIPGIRLED